MENAIIKHFLLVYNIFSKIKNPYLNQRAEDFQSISNKLLATLAKDKNSLDSIEKGAILFTENLNPVDIINLLEKDIAGICLEKGSTTSHTSIIIKSVGLKSIVDTKNILRFVKQDQIVILDSNNSEIILSPSKEVLANYQQQLVKEDLHKKNLRKFIDKPIILSSGKKIKIMANIELPQEVDCAINMGCEGIGLLRTEFLFINRKKLPKQEDQAKIYSSLADKIKPHPLVIRTIDAGGDKGIDILNIGKEENPNLGLRGIRVCLNNIELFKTQIKAILQASYSGNIKILLPMISNMWELDKSKKIIQECKTYLSENKIDYDKNIQVGIMVEIPSVAVEADKFSKNCDFFSIGTNDLIQYLFAVDRNNQKVQHYFNHKHPLVLDIIKKVVYAAHKNRIKVAICGEVASDVNIVAKLVAAGVDELSVGPSSILEIKKTILNSGV